MKCRVIHVGITAAVSVALALGLTAPVQAAQVLSSSTDPLSSEIDSLPNAEPVVLGNRDPDLIAIPKQADDGLQVPTPDGDQVGIDLPVPEEANANLTSGGSAVYHDPSDEVTLTVQAVDVSRVEGVDSAVRAVISIYDKSSPRNYAFDLDLPDGAEAIVQPSGEVLIANATGGVIAAVGSPWAVDASGKSVPTRFEIKHGRLIQHVDHRGAQYPVIADPIWVVSVVVVGARVAVKYTVKAATKNAAKKAAKKAAQKAGKKVKKVKTPKKQKYKKFTKKNLRHNLTIYTKKCVVSTCHAHHMMPVKFEKQFKAAGINPHHPKYGRWWTGQSKVANNHQAKAAEYNKKWDNFFTKLGWEELSTKQKKGKKKQIIKYAKKLDKAYKKFYRC